MKRQVLSSIPSFTQPYVFDPKALTDKLNRLSNSNIANASDSEQTPEELAAREKEENRKKTGEAFQAAIDRSRTPKKDGKSKSLININIERLLTPTKSSTPDPQETREEKLDKLRKGVEKFTTPKNTPASSLANSASGTPLSLSRTGSLRITNKDLLNSFYSVIGPVERIIPVNYYIPGRPPRPEAIIYGVAVALGLIDKKTAPVEFKQAEFPIPRYHPSDLHREGDLVVYSRLEKV